jgi:alpha-L-rhamnosidase
MIVCMMPVFRFVRLPVGLAFFAALIWFFAFSSALGAPAAVPLKAKWIWLPAKASEDNYNQTIIARRTLKLDKPASATMRITADTVYRLKINGTWVNDGPCRSWPEHFQYDELDVAPYLVDGQNQVEIIACFFGTGDFHHVPREPGLLAQMDVTTANGKVQSLITDGNWHIARANAWVANTPKISIQMGPAEWYDARLETLNFTRAAVRHEVESGPWKNLNPRDVALLTKHPFQFKTFVDARLVKTPGTNFTLPAARLVHPGLIEANHNVSISSGMATVLLLDEPATVVIESDVFDLAIGGDAGKGGVFELPAGRHLVLAFTRDAATHRKEQSLRFVRPENPRLDNPLKGGHQNPWCFLRFPEVTFATNDMFWIGFGAENPLVAEKTAAYRKLSSRFLNEVRDKASFQTHLGQAAELLPFETMFAVDSVPDTWRREVIGDARHLVKQPAALMHDTPESTLIAPPDSGDIELLYDLGEQNCGYYNFDLVADAGVVLDIVGVEYITPEGRVQWSVSNRNGMRYITREGRNSFTSMKRRSGRYLFVTLRNVRSPVRIRHLNLIESTYPIDAVGSFSCSDTRLDRIWEISARTMKLCMEDTYTDCPLYEQTHWVGDARNESLFGYTAFGAEDLGRRCARQTAQSLGRFPITGAQVPSSWECLLPAWSFLWGISTWDYFWHTGDAKFLRELHPAVIKNLKGAESFVDERGLFTAPFWNFFDWTPIDQNQKTVLHNSMFLVGAIDAALRSEAALGCTEHAQWLRELRARLVAGVNALWDPAKGAYPDSLRADGKPSPSTSQHTSFLAVLYDIIDQENLAQARRNMIEPPSGMVQIGSPFAALYLYEALEKLGLEQEIINQTYTNYLPMLEAGATTVWESFPTGTTGGSGFPTRSHSHAWSSAPLYFLNRIVLGLKSTAPGWANATLSPLPGDLKWAHGVSVTPHGPVQVAWQIKGNRMEITCKAPKQIKVEFKRNASLEGLTVSFNGKELE